jgi:restriction endonuclease S subunit
VQREIVRVLDKFTQLEAELEAELEARQRQYEYYRKQLFGFSKSTSWVLVGEIGEVRSGWGFPKSYQGQKVGGIPFYKVSDMNLIGNETSMTNANNYVCEDVVKELKVNLAPAGTVIFPKIGAAIATNKKRLLSIDSAYDNNVMGIIPGPKAESRFLLYWMQQVDLSQLAHHSGAVPSIRKTEMERLEVPLPPLEEQRRIVSILDKFDSLVNDLSIGLPAELAARRKQYEYYRDRLLTFEEKR